MPDENHAVSLSNPLSLSSLHGAPIECWALIGVDDKLTRKTTIQVVNADFVPSDRAPSSNKNSLEDCSENAEA